MSNSTAVPTYTFYENANGFVFAANNEEIYGPSGIDGKWYFYHECIGKSTGETKHFNFTLSSADLTQCTILSRENAIAKRPELFVQTPGFPVL